MAKKQHTLKNPYMNNKELSVSKEVYNMVIRAQKEYQESLKIAQGKESDAGKALAAVYELQESTYYQGQSRDLTLNLKFNRTNTIAIETDPQKEDEQFVFTGELAYLELPENKELKTQKKIELFQILSCVSEALKSRHTEAQEEVKKIA